MSQSEIKIPIAPLNAVPPGEGRSFDIGGERIAVFRTRSGEVFATQAECPHKHGPLADALVGGNTIICPLHSWTFDMATGEALVGECGLKTYRAEIDESNRIVIGIALGSATETTL